MTKTMRKQRTSYTDKLNAATTWQEVLDLKDDQGFINYIPLNEFSDDVPDTTIIFDEFEPLEVEGYEELVDIIENLLTEGELNIFKLIAEENQSLRKVAVQVGMSHESVRTVYKNCVVKLREAIETLRGYNAR